MIFLKLSMTTLAMAVAVAVVFGWLVCQSSSFRRWGGRVVEGQRDPSSCRRLRRRTRERRVRRKVIEGRDRPKKIHRSTWAFPQRVDIKVGGQGWTFKDVLGSVWRTHTGREDVVR
jgi:hypothetical protein